MTHRLSIRHDLAALAVAAAATAAAASITACGGSPEQDPAPTASAEASKADAPAAPPSAEAEPPALWGAEGRGRITPVAERPADPAARWPGQRYATQAQLERELLLAEPFTMVIDVDDEAAVVRALQLGESLTTYGSDKTLLALFVRSRQPALAARLAERLMREQGWEHVWVVI